MSLTWLFVTAFVVGLSGALTPGPLLTITIQQASRVGVAAGPLVVAGHAIVEAAVVVGLATGLSSVLALPTVTGSIGLLGGLTLAWMGYTIVRGAVSGRLALTVTASEGGDSRRGRSEVLLAGVLASISNPYWVLWWATVGATYVVLAAGKGPLYLATFYAGHIASDAVWLFTVALVIGSGRALVNDRLYRGILGACGVFLLGLAVYFFYYGLVAVKLAPAL